MASDIPFDHRKCSLWQTRIAEIGDNDWMHGTVGGKSGRRVCLRESGRHRRAKPQNSARSSELGRSGLNQPARPTPRQPKLPLDPLTGKSLTLSHAQWLTVGIGVNRGTHKMEKQSSLVFNIFVVPCFQWLQSTSFRKDPCLP